MYSQLLITFKARRGTLRVGDRLDTDGQRELERRIEDALAAGCQRLDVDCRRVRYVERDALVALASARERLAEDGGALVMTGCSPVFARTARVGGFPELTVDAESRS